MENEDFAYIEENFDTSSNESQRQVTLDAGKSIGWAQSPTEKESATAEIDPPPTWNVVVLRLHLIHCHHSHFHVLINMAMEHPSPNFVRNHVRGHELRGQD